MAEVVISDKEYEELSVAATAFACAVEDMREELSRKFKYVLFGGGVAAGETAANLRIYIGWVDDLDNKADELVGLIASDIENYIIAVDDADQDLN